MPVEPMDLKNTGVRNAAGPGLPVDGGQQTEQIVGVISECVEVPYDIVITAILFAITHKRNQPFQMHFGFSPFKIKEKREIN